MSEQDWAIGDFVWLDGAAAEVKSKKRFKLDTTSAPPAHAIILQVTHFFSQPSKFDCTGVKYLRAKDVFGAKSLDPTKALYKTMDHVKFTFAEIKGKVQFDDHFVLFPAVYDVRTKRIISQSASCSSAPTTATAAAKETQHQIARRMLQNSTRPSVALPCRQKERARIQAFIERGIKNHGSKLGLYISGLPGSGKTFTVREVVRDLRAREMDFDFIEINGLKVDCGDEVFSTLARHFLPTTTTTTAAGSKSARVELDAYFRHKDQSKRTTTVLLIDEMDQLMDEDVLFHLFNFAQHTTAQLVILCIANTLDLNERVMSKIRSRLGEEKISFASYGKEDIEQILLDRLVECNVFERDAISFCALKTASTSGDIRRAMRVCNRALDFCIAEQQQQLVTVPHITQAWMDLETGSMTKAIRFLSPLEKLILISVLKLGNKTTFEHIYRRVINVGQLIPEVKQCLPMPQSLMSTCKDKLCTSKLLLEDADTLQLSLGVDQEDLNQIMNADLVFRNHIKS